MLAIARDSMYTVAPIQSPHGAQLAVKRSFLFNVSLSLGAWVFVSWYAACHISHFRDFAPDDAFITYIYGRNLAEGHGLRYNPADSTPTEGFSSLLHVVITALGYRLGIEGLTLTRGVNALVFGFMSILIAATASTSINIPFYRTLLPSVLVLVASFVVEDTRMHLASGMETVIYMGLHALVYYWAVGMIIRAKTGRIPTLAGMALLFALTIGRPEGLFLSGLYLLAILLALLVKENPKTALSVVAPTATGLALLVTAFSIFKFFHFGYLLPNPYYVKTHHSIFGGDVPLLPGWRETAEYFVARVSPLVFLTLVAVAGKPHIQRSTVLTAFLPIAPSVVVAISYAGAIHEVSFGNRYGYPMLVPFLVLLVAALSMNANSRSRQIAWALLLLASCFSILDKPGIKEGAGWLRHPIRSATGWFGYRPERPTLARVGLDLAKTELKQRATILLSGAGQVPYYSRFYTIDWIGLNTNYLSGRYPLSLDEVWHYIDEKKPDVIYSLVPPASSSAESKESDPGFMSPAVQNFLRGHSCTLFRYWNRERLEEMFYREMVYVRDHYIFGAAYLLQENGAVLLYIRKNSPYYNTIHNVLKESKRADSKTDLTPFYNVDPRELR